MINQPTTLVSIANVTTSPVSVSRPTVGVSSVVNGAAPTIAVITPQLRNPVYWDDLEMTWDSATFTWDETTDATPITNISV